MVENLKAEETSCLEAFECTDLVLNFSCKHFIWEVCQEAVQCYCASFRSCERGGRERHPEEDKLIGTQRKS